MKRAILASLIFAACATTAAASKSGDGVEVGKVNAERNGNYLSVDMNIDMQNLKVEPNRAVLLTPVIANGEQSVSMPSVGVYGRRRYLYYKRNFSDTMLSGKDETTIRAKKKPSEVGYHYIMPYEEWMDGATISLSRSDYGCCRQLLSSEADEVGIFREAFFPQLVYLTPQAAREKRRVLEGRAYIDFPVDQTVIYPDYRRNAIELERIRATIDTVRTDPDATIDTVWLKGFASPESPYQHNTELAIGRTQALKRYLQNLYNFSSVAMMTDYEPEDWAGLRVAVEGSNLEHKNEILELIDADIEPDRKEWLIKSRYVDDYKFMLNTYYPALRHTDYRVSYVVRTYSDPQEILSIMRAHPQHLDLTEFYIAASELEPGTDEFTEVFETAVRMYPDDETANLNAANAAMRRGDNAGAERYLLKAGNSAEAKYARGAIAIRKGDYDTARRYLRAAQAAGLAQAGVTLNELNERLKENN